MEDTIPKTILCQTHQDQEIDFFILTKKTNFISRFICFACLKAQMNSNYDISQEIIVDKHQISEQKENLTQKIMENDQQFNNLDLIFTSYKKEISEEQIIKNNLKHLLKSIPKEQENQEIFSQILEEFDNYFLFTRNQQKKYLEKLPCTLNFSQIHELITKNFTNFEEINQKLEDSLQFIHTQQNKLLDSIQTDLYTNISKINNFFKNLPEIILKKVKNSNFYQIIQKNEQKIQQLQKNNNQYLPFEPTHKSQLKRFYNKYDLNDKTSQFIQYLHCPPKERKSGKRNNDYDLVISSQGFPYDKSINFRLKIQSLLRLSSLEDRDDQKGLFNWKITQQNSQNYTADIYFSYNMNNFSIIGPEENQQEEISFLELIEVEKIQDWEIFLNISQRQIKIQNIPKMHQKQYQKVVDLQFQENSINKEELFALSFIFKNNAKRDIQLQFY